MISAGELRHNSYYHFEKYGIGKLFVTDEFNFAVDFPNGSSEDISKFCLSQITPVTFSSELFDMLRFNKKRTIIALPDDFWYEKEFSGIGNVYTSDKNKFLNCEQLNNQTFDNLHQFQNLLFAISGEEINLW